MIKLLMEKKKRIDLDNNKLSMADINVNINYIEHVSGRSSVNLTCHSHIMWQAEFITEGSVTTHFNDQDIEINPMKILIIPAGIFHSLSYNDKHSEYYSVKFSCDHLHHLTPLIFDDPTNVRPIKKFLDEVVSNCSDTEIIAVYIRNILQILLEIDLVNSKALPEKNISEQVISMLEQSPSRFPSAEEIADKMLISRAYLSKQIKEETGVSLKPFIDIQRINIGKTLLQLSELSISEIAYQLGFNDVFSFSRFFKRLTFASPSQYRLKYQKEEFESENDCLSDS